MKNKKAQADLGKKVKNIILLSIGIIVLLSVYTVVVPEAQEAGNGLSALPLGASFSPTGIVILLVMAGLFIIIFRAILRPTK